MGEEKHLKQVYESKTKIRLRKKMGGKMTTKSCQVGLDWSGSDRVKSDQVGSCQVGLGQVKLIQVEPVNTLKNLQS